MAWTYKQDFEVLWADGDALNDHDSWANGTSANDGWVKVTSTFPAHGTLGVEMYASAFGEDRVRTITSTDSGDFYFSIGFGADLDGNNSDVSLYEGDTLVCGIRGGWDYSNDFQVVGYDGTLNTLALGTSTATNHNFWFNLVFDKTAGTVKARYKRDDAAGWSAFSSTVALSMTTGVNKIRMFCADGGGSHVPGMYGYFDYITPIDPAISEARTLPRFYRS